MTRHIRIIPALLLAAGAVGGIASPSQAAPPGCHGAVSLQSVTATGPGTAHVQASVSRCVATLDAVAAFGPDIEPVFIAKATSSAQYSTISADVVLPIGTRRVCAVAYGDWADECVAVTVTAGANGAPTVPVVGGPVGTVYTATDGWSTHPGPTDPRTDPGGGTTQPECSQCW